MGLEKFVKYCEKNQQERTKDGFFEHGKFISDIVREPEIIGIRGPVKKRCVNIILYEKGRFGGNVNMGVIDVVLIGGDNEIYVCMAKVCNRSGRRVRRRLEYARKYLKENFEIDNVVLLSARRYGGKTHSRIVNVDREVVLR